MVRRRGLTLFELVVALFVLTTAMMAIVQLLAVAAGQRRTIAERRTARAEVANQAERIALRPWSELNAEKSSTWDLSPESQKALPQATTVMEIHAEPEPVNSRRIRLIVRSPNAAGQPIDLADLTVWKFAPGGQP
jgi:Tfp pilus assembly protein PilV